MTPQEKEIADLKAQIIRLEGYKARSLANDGYAEVGRAACAILNSRGANLPAGGPGAADAVIKCLIMGKDFERLIEAIKSDDMLQSEWDRFCMSLRLVEEN